MSVTVREKAIKKGIQKSLYLDFYPPIRNPRTGKLTRREFLGIYIFSKPSNEIEKQYNKEKKAIAEGVRASREIAILNNKYGFIDKSQSKESFLGYFKENADKKNDHTWQTAYKHFAKYTNETCSFNDITIELANGFKDYLLNANNIRHNNETSLKTNTALSYFRKFRTLLKSAFKENRLHEDINNHIDGIKEEETFREYLTQDELFSLNDTPCEIDILKRAALFSCLTGLRFSDIQKLSWNEVVVDNAGDPTIRFRQKKTNKIENEYPYVYLNSFLLEIQAINKWSNIDNP